MDRNQKIIKNTIIFAIGNFGSKVLTYLMVLVYTHYIDRSDLGYYDLVLTTVSLVQPIILMAFDEGIYRWLIGEEKVDKKVIVSTCLKATTITSLASVGLLFLLNLKFQLRDVSLIALFVITTMMYQMVLNAIRGLTNNKLYAWSGILNSLLILAFEVIGLVFLSMGIEALLISKILANIVTIVYIYCKEKLFHGIARVKYDKGIAKEVFSYSMPLVPNQVSWWIVNFSDRYIILAFLGTAFNGIYAVANKFPTVITTITSIVYFALQEAIIKEYYAEDRDDFYSATFKNYYTLLFSLIWCAIPATFLVIHWFIGSEYIDAGNFTGFLYLSTVFNALSSFLGIGYQISKETKRSILSTTSAAGINILINILFIRIIGLHAASLSTFVAYLCLFFIRIAHSRKYFTLKIDWVYFGGIALGAVAVMIISFFGNTLINIALVVITFPALLFMNKTLIKSVKKRRDYNGTKRKSTKGI